MSGVKGKSGRHKDESTVWRIALARIDDKTPELVDKLIEKALNGDKDCLIYLLDRKYGRPHQPIDQRIKGELNIDYGELKFRVIAAAREWELEQKEQIKLLDNPVDEGGNNE